MRSLIASVVVVGLVCIPAKAALEWDFNESFDNTNFFSPDGGPLTVPDNPWNGSWTEYSGSLSPIIDWDGGYGGSVGVVTGDAVGTWYGAWINEHPGRVPFGPELWSPPLGTDGLHDRANVNGQIWMDPTGSDYRQAYVEIRNDEFDSPDDRYIRVGYVANDPDEGNQDYYFWAWKDDDDSGMWRTLPGEIPGDPVIVGPGDTAKWLAFGFGYDVGLTHDNVSIMVFEGTGDDVEDPDNWRFTMGWPTDVNIADPADLDTWAFNGTGLGVAFDRFGVNIVPGACFGDIDGDGDIDLSDLAQLLSNYGETSGMTYEDGDLDGDGDVDLADLAALLAVYGTTC